MLQGLLAACMMHVARIAPALQLVRPWSGAGPLFSTVLHEYFPFQYTISLIENNYWHNTVTMTIYAWPDHLTSPGPPLWCKFMWKYQDYAVTSSSKAEGGNLEQSCRLKTEQLISHLYCLHEVGVQHAVTVASMADPVPWITILLQSEELWREAQACHV